MQKIIYTTLIRLNNVFKRIYCGTSVNYAVEYLKMKIGSFFIERRIKKRGDEILTNNSFIGSTYYTIHHPAKKEGDLSYSDLIWFKYKWFKGYWTRQMVEDIKEMSNNTLSLSEIQEEELRLVKEVEKEINKDIIKQIIKNGNEKRSENNTSGL
jgi:signal peptidase I